MITNVKGPPACLLTCGAIDCHDDGLADEDDDGRLLAAELQATLNVHQRLQRDFTPQHLPADTRQGHCTVN